RWPSTPPATPWCPCWRCSMHWPPTFRRPYCRPDPTGCCESSCRMTEAHAFHRDNVAVLIPALNEELRIREVVQGALAHCPHVIVVDDGSDDGTVAALADLPVTLLRHPRRMGKGASLRDGFAQALRMGARAVITMDGDGHHSGEDIPRLIAAANRHPGCLINGARLRKRSQQPLYR